MPLAVAADAHWRGARSSRRPRQRRPRSGAADHGWLPRDRLGAVSQGAAASRAGTRAPLIWRAARGAAGPSRSHGAE